MKSLFLALPLSLFALQAPAEEKWTPAYEITGISKDPLLFSGEAMLVITCYDPQYYPLSNSVQLTHSAGQVTLQPDRNGRISLKRLAGKTPFYFVTRDCNEIATDTIRLESNDKVEMTVRFSKIGVGAIAFKPVIYIYPEKEMDVQVKLEKKEKLTFTYPAHGEGWNVKAAPDGSLRANGKTYNYLFWEGGIDLSPKDIRAADGFIVGKDSLLAFLETSLETIGLHSKEAQDFITYWYPRMMAHDRTYVRFLFNEEFSKYAPLEISPQPDQLIRVFMLWSPLEGEAPVLKAQTLPSFARKGFTVLEWGGTELEPGALKLPH